MSIHKAALLAAIAGVAANASAQDVVFQLVQTEDISVLSSGTTSFFIGSNPDAIAWNGEDLFVAGFENSGVGSTTLIAQINDFLDTPNRTFSIVGGSEATTPAFRSRPGLDWDAELGLLASHDLGNNTDPGQFQIFTENLDGSYSLSQSSTAGRGIAGPSWDYGPDGQGFLRSDGSTGTIAAVLDFTESQPIGQLGPIGLDPFDLSVIYFVEQDEPGGTLYGGGGPDISFDGVADTLWRDLDINPDGGIAARVSQDLVIVERDSSNLASSLIKVEDPNNDISWNVANTSWLYDSTVIGEDVIIYNGARTNSSTGTFTDCNTLVARDGTPLTYSVVDDQFNEILTFPVGNCAYDFAWDPTLEYLFVVEFSTRLVYVLQPVDPVAPCPADVNGDGVLDNGDIGAFVQLFLLGDLAADFNGDGILDNGDIGAFVTAFLAGCA